MTQGVPDCIGVPTHRVTTNAKTLERPRVLASNVGDTGFDSPQESTGKVAVRNKSGAKSGALHDADAILAAHDDPRLLAVIDAWPMLGEAAREAVVRAAGLRPDDMSRGDIRAALETICEQRD